MGHVTSYRSLLRLWGGKVGPKDQVTEWSGKFSPWLLRIPTSILQSHKTTLFHGNN